LQKSLPKALSFPTALSTVPEVLVCRTLHVLMACTVLQHNMLHVRICTSFKDCCLLGYDAI